MKPRTKKAKERAILDYVYDPDAFERITESERPDFTIHCRDASEPFGVEITEYYASESSARLRNIPDYAVTLLDGGNPRHRDDIEALRPAEAEILSPTGLSQGKIMTIITRLPTLSNHIAALCGQITNKEQQLQGYQRNLSHVNLIIYDTGSCFASTRPEEFYRLFLTTEMKSVLFTTPFREVFYITTIGGSRARTVYVALRQVLLVSELYLFNGACNRCADEGPSMSPSRHLSLFATFMGSRNLPVSAIVDDEYGVEVRLGNTGVVVSDGWHVNIRDFCDRVCSGVPAAPDDLSILGSDFDAIYDSFVANNTFTSGLMYDIRKPGVSGRAPIARMYFR